MIEVENSIAVHREQNPPGAHFFEPTDPAALVRAVEQALVAPVEVEADALAAQAERVSAYGRDFCALAAETHEAA